MYKHTKVYSLKVEVKKKESETGVAACQVNIIKEVFVRTTLSRKKERRRNRNL